MIQVSIGEKKFLIYESTADALAGLLEGQKRFWEWEGEIARLQRWFEASRLQPVRRRRSRRLAGGRL